MRKSIYICLLWLFTTATLSAQISVSGTVIDVADNLTIIGVNIIEAGTSNGTISDIDGNFTINVKDENSILIFSYIGYTSKEVTVGQQRVLNITMSTSSTELDEIVIIGYGRQKKRVATGAISKLSSESFEGIKVQDVQTALVGQVSGLIVNESSGQPGSGKSILIRGVSTNGDNSPLFIVDGLQVNSIDNINPGDIESVDVLKDAASSAIYGARGANGVVIVTTKKGKDDKGSISYDGFVSNSRPWRLPTMLNSQDYIRMTRQKFANAGQTTNINNLGFPQIGDDVANTNWMDIIFEPALVQSHRLSATGKNRLISMEYWDQKGVVGGDKSRYKRYGLRINTSKEINKYITVGENLYINRIENPQIGVNDAFGTVIADAIAYDPITGVYNDEKQYGFEQSKWVQKEYINPLSRLFISNGDGHRDQVLGNAYIEIKPLKHFKIRSDFGMDYSWNKFRNFTPDYEFHAAFRNVSNDVSQGYGFGQSWQFENYLNYNNKFGDHNVDFIFGTSYRTSSNEWAGGSSSSLPEDVKFNENWQWLDSGIDTTDLTYGSRGVKYALISYYGRAIYDYKSTYLFTTTLRRDGSSNFGANNRWGLFPSFSLGWVISNESFFEDLGSVSFLKLRGSWGVNGNDRISPLAYAARVENVFTYPIGYPQTLNTGAALATPPNPNIKWEESVQLDIGLEAKFFNDKLGLELDYYIKNTKDLLMSQTIPGYIGATNNPISNLGEIENKGIEASVSYRILFSNDLKVNTSLNYTTFTNTVKDVAGEAGFISGYGWPVRNTSITRMTEGLPVGHFVGYKTDGIFKSDDEVWTHLNADGDRLQPMAKAGDLKFVDVNGDGKINSEDLTDIGSPWPKHIIGLALGANFKGIDVNMVLSAQLGHQIYKTYERSDLPYTNYTTYWLDSWTEENPDSDIPRLISTDPNNNQRPSDFYVEDASYLRMKNLQIGYTLPTKLTEKFQLGKLRFYISANNLFTITNYTGFDPDIGSSGWILDTGIDKGYYPSNKTFGLGLQVGI